MAQDPVDFDLGRHLDGLDREDRFGELLDQADKLLTDEAKLLLRDPKATAMEADQFAGWVAADVWNHLVFSLPRRRDIEIFGRMLDAIDRASTDGHPMSGVAARSVRQTLIDLYVNESRDKLAERLQRNARYLREEMDGEQ